MKTKIKDTLFIATALVALSLLFTRCDSGDEFENTVKNSVNFDLSGEILQGAQNTLIIDEANPANSYIHVDSVGQYGFGMHYNLPDSLKDCNLKLVLSGKMRETESVTGYIAIALHGKDTMLYWGNVFGYIHIKQPNTWFDFKDSVIIPRAANLPSSLFLKVFPFKQTGKGFYDVDNLTIKITRE
jgi:hypothetical protein